MRTTATLRTNDNAREIAALRAELTQLTAMVELHTDCLQTAAEAIKTLQQKELKKAPASKKQPTKKASALKEQGRPWNKLTKDEKHKLNAYAYRHLEEVGGSWEAWEAKRTSLMFR